MPLFRIDNICLNFPDGRIFENFSFDIEPGDKVVFAGQSGSGKTSLINLLLGFIKPNSGSIHYKDDPYAKATLRQLRSESAYLPQEYKGDLSLAEKLFLTPYLFAANVNNCPDRDSISETLKLFGLNPSILKKEASSLSGGERQRLLLCSLFMMKKPVMFLDEPTSSLDAENTKKLIGLFMSDSRLTLISSSHDTAWVNACNKVVDLNQLKKEE